MTTRKDRWEMPPAYLAVGNEKDKKLIEDLKYNCENSQPLFTFESAEYGQLAFIHHSFEEIAFLIRLFASRMDDFFDAYEYVRSLIDATCAPVDSLVPGESPEPGITFGESLQTTEVDDFSKKYLEHYSEILSDKGLKEATTRSYDAIESQSQSGGKNSESPTYLIVHLHRKLIGNRDLKELWPKTYKLIDAKLTTGIPMSMSTMATSAASGSWAAVDSDYSAIEIPEDGEAAKETLELEGKDSRWIVATVDDVSRYLKQLNHKTRDHIKITTTISEQLLTNGDQERKRSLWGIGLNILIKRPKPPAMPVRIYKALPCPW